MEFANLKSIICGVLSFCKHFTYKNWGLKDEKAIFAGIER